MRILQVLLQAYSLAAGRAVAVQDKVLTLFRELQQQNEGKVEFIIISTKLFHIDHCHTAGVQ